MGALACAPVAACSTHLRARWEHSPESSDEAPSVWRGCKSRSHSQGPEPMAELSARL